MARGRGRPRVGARKDRHTQAGGGKIIPGGAACAMMRAFRPWTRRARRVPIKPEAVLRSALRGRPPDQRSVASGPGSGEPGVACAHQRYKQGHTGATMPGSPCLATSASSGRRCGDEGAGSTSRRCGLVRDDKDQQPSAERALTGFVPFTLAGRGQGGNTQASRLLLHPTSPSTSRRSFDRGAVR
jgi:hypothetical protein